MVITHIWWRRYDGVWNIKNAASDDFKIYYKVSPDEISEKE